MIVQLKQYGRTLTDRSDGQRVFREILNSHKSPFSLDFSGVMSLGSSFGDEVVLKLAELQGNKIEVINANQGIIDCIGKVIEGKSVSIKYTKQ